MFWLSFAEIPHWVAPKVCKKKETSILSLLQWSNLTLYRELPHHLCPETIRSWDWKESVWISCWHWRKTKLYLEFHWICRNKWFNTESWPLYIIKAVKKRKEKKTFLICRFNICSILMLLCLPLKSIMQSQGDSQVSNRQHFVLVKTCFALFTLHTAAACHVSHFSPSSPSF